MAHYFTRFFTLRNTNLFLIHKNTPFKNKISWKMNKQIYKMYSNTGRENMPTIKYILEKLGKIMGVKNNHCVNLPKNVNELEPRSMQDSFTSAIIPLSSDMTIKNDYFSFLGTAKLVKLLEDMDLFAVWVVYQHMKYPGQNPDQPPYALATALIDKIDFTDVVPMADQDMKLSGHVSWVGRSSVEVVVWLEQMKDGKWQKITRALFLMAARSPSFTGSALVNPIKPANERERKILAGGELRKEKRLKIRNESLKKVIPNEAEQLAIHNLFLSTMSVDDISLTKLMLPPNSEWMENFKLTNIAIPHPDNSNFYDKVFGGFIMRNAYELSFALACLYCKHIPKLKHISDVIFHKPVNIDSLIHMTSYVVYTYKNFIQITVFAESTYKSSDKLNTTNEFHFTFQLNDTAKTVIPKSYLETMLYINGKRHLEQIFVEGNLVPDSLNSKL